MGLDQDQRLNAAGAPLTRRQALLGAAAAIAVADLAMNTESLSWWRSLLPARDAFDNTADVFPHDAPNDAVWSQWQKRGWAREALHYVKLGRNVQCKVCPNNCLLTPGDRSHCRNKINRDGTLYTLAYANPCTVHVDPVEKKPLFHFLPGARTLSLATSGCVFRCLNCQNWEISQQRPEDTKDATGREVRLRAIASTNWTDLDLRRLSFFPEDIAPVARALRCPAVAYTYSEPTAYYEYLLDSCRAVRSAGLKNIVVTCGSIEERPLRDLAGLVDAAHIDLKGFDEATYRRLNSGKLSAVLRTLKIYHELGIWFEVINLVVPGYTDNLDGIHRMCDWLAANLGPDRPLHFSRFFPQHKLEYLEPTPIEALLRARDIAVAAGLRYVYIGNVPELRGTESTTCPGCRRVVVERQGYAITRMNIADGKCRFCETAIPGIWTA